MRRTGAVMVALTAALPLMACGSGTPPPLTGNVVDARGGHAGGFLPANASSDEQAGASTANSQDAPR